VESPGSLGPPRKFFCRICFSQLVILARLSRQGVHVVIALSGLLKLDFVYSSIVNEAKKVDCYQKFTTLAEYCRKLHQSHIALSNLVSRFKPWD